MFLNASVIVLMTKELDSPNNCSLLYDIEKTIFHSFPCSEIYLGSYIFTQWTSAVQHFGDLL